MTTATKTPSIPKIDYGLSMSGATHRMLAVDIDRTTVVYAYNDLTVTFSVTESGRRLDLSGAIRSGDVVGRAVFQAVVSCGGTLPEEYVEAPGSVEDLATVHAAMPYFYDATRDPEERKVLRSVYRNVASHLQVAA